MFNKILINKGRNKFYLSCGKRMFDLALAIPAIIVLMPLLILIALLVRFILGSPVFFKQM